MTPKQLKQSILQLAFEGKLVEHSKEDAFSLLKQISEIKSRKKVKSKKYLPIENIEKPFDIPDTWEWVYLSDIAYVNGGYAFKSTEYKENGVRVIRISDFNENGFVNNKIVRTNYSNDIDDYKLEVHDILLCMTGGTVGKSFFVDSLSEDMYTNQRVATIKILNPNKSFINYAILAPFTQKIIQDSKNSTNDNISMDLINTFLIPLPPLEEQNKIVAKIEEIIPLVERYEEAWNRLEIFNKKFPFDMEKSILKYAMQGKLVEQIAEEGNGDELFKLIQKEKQVSDKNKKEKNKTMSAIVDDEIPFSIPSTWKWTRIGEIFEHSAGKALNSSDREGKEYTYITTSNVFWNSFEMNDLKKMFYKESELEKCSAKKGDLLVLEGGDIGRSAIWNYDYDIRIQNHIHRLRPNKYLDVNFYYYLFFLYKNSGLINGKGIGIQGLSANRLKSLVVPLPPLEEQKRIVAKIEELLPLCKSLQK